MASKDSKSKEMTKFIADIHEKYDVVKEHSSEYISTGIMALDVATGKGGIPRAILIDMYGDEGLGKTTMTLTMMAERIRNGEHCAYVDVEHRLRPELIDQIIPDKSLFHVFEPKDGSAALSTLETMANMKDIRMVAIDSLAALVMPEMNDPDKRMEPIAINARYISLSVKKLLEPVFRNNTIVIFINQMRISPMAWGVQKLPTGPKAVRFNCSLRIKLNGDEDVKSGTEKVGHKLELTIEKNTFGPPWRKAYVTLMYGEGIDRAADVVDAGVACGVIDKAASWFTYKEKNEKDEIVSEVKAHGEKDLLEKLIAAKLLDSVRDRIRAAVIKKNPVIVAPESKPSEEDDD